MNKYKTDKINFSAVIKVIFLSPTMNNGSRVKFSDGLKSKSIPFDYSLGVEYMLRRFMEENNLKDTHVYAFCGNGEFIIIPQSRLVSYRKDSDNWY